MKTIDPKTETVWLNAREFAAKQNKVKNTIYKWCASGFIIELGFVLSRDATGHYLIGVPKTHPAYQQFA
jgi:hypothetical protein